VNLDLSRRLTFLEEVMNEITGEAERSEDLPALPIAAPSFAAVGDDVAEDADS
jgi:hypothetical protein